MKITAQLHQKYREFFIDDTNFEYAMMFDHMPIVQGVNINYLYDLLENESSYDFTYDEDNTTFRIDVDDYEMRIAVLPTSDYVTFMINKSTNKRSNYRRMMQQIVVYQYLLDFGILPKDNSFEQNYYQFQQMIKTKSRSLDLEGLLPTNKRREIYKPFFKNEVELEKWLDYPESKETVTLMSDFLDQYLNSLLGHRSIISYEKNGLEYSVKSNRYDFVLLVLHFGDVAAYSVNKRTGEPANLGRAMRIQAVKNMIDKYL
ncbi:MAG TPA: hypothetical protein VNR38_18935 [Ureibacillus sp.]|nr:hypothetical protein [Ureibacillus sp.]